MYFLLIKWGTALLFLLSFNFSFAQGLRLENHLVNNREGPVEEFEAKENIEASNFLIPVGKNAAFKSCNEIHLKPGFKAVPGSSFTAEVGGCKEEALSIQEEKSSTKVSLFKADLVLNCSPNPFQTTTTIAYRLKTMTDVRLAIYDLNGGLVRELKNERQVEGNYFVDFEAKDLPAGLYYAKLNTGESIVTAKMMLVK